MNYSKIYDRFCDSQRKVQISRSSHQISFQVHRVVPEGLWGSDAADTLLLTHREQIFAYRLLRKIHPNSRIVADNLKKLLRGYKPIRKIPRRRRSPSPEARRNISEAMIRKNITRSPETRAKMSEAKLGQSLTAEHILKRSESRRRNHRGYDEQARLNMSRAAKNRNKPNHWSIAK